jgi:hypothetical protein
VLNDNELQKILYKAIEAAGGVSAWVRANKVFSQRGNVDMMYQGKRPISEAIAKKLGYRLCKNRWERDN